MIMNSGLQYLLDEINRRAKCVVQITLTTYDDDLCGILEPNVCNTKRRIEVLDIMRERGIPTVVWLTPILPFINDTEENVAAILNECVRTGVKGVIICRDNGIMSSPDECFAYMRELPDKYPQMSIFDF